jgi:hypothetical protein
MSENYDEETGEVYDLDEYVSFANTPVKDEERYIKAKLISIDKKQFIDRKKRTSKDLADDITKIAFKFLFHVVGTNGFISMSILTGTNISPDKTYIKAKGRGKEKEIPEYNKLTELLLRLKIFNIDELNKRDETVLKKTSNIIKTINENPIFIKAKLEMQDNESNYSTLNIKSIEVIPSF